MEGNIPEHWYEAAIVAGTYKAKRKGGTESIYACEREAEVIRSKGISGG